MVSLGNPGWVPKIGFLWSLVFFFIQKIFNLPFVFKFILNYIESQVHCNLIFELVLVVVHQLKIQVIGYKLYSVV